MRETAKIAQLVFIRDAYDEAKLKPIFKNDSSRNYQLYTYLNQRIISVANNTPYDTYVISTKNQIGDQFAQRFKNAFKSIFELGYDAVISVGNDVPQVNAETILNVVDAFADYDVVIGKTSSNGAYTVGLTKYAFSKCDFDEVDWSSSNVVQSIEKRAHTQGSSYFQLKDVYYEINTHEDLRILLQSVKQCEISFQGMLFLMRLFYGKREVIELKQAIHTLISSGSFEIRGSPCFKV